MTIETQVRCLFVLVLVLILCAGLARAEVIDRIEVVSASRGETEIVIWFAQSVAYRSSSPKSAGRIVRIYAQPVEGGLGDPTPTKEVVFATARGSLPAFVVSYPESDSALTVAFAKTVSFRVVQTRAESISVFVQSPENKSEQNTRPGLADRRSAEPNPVPTIPDVFYPQTSVGDHARTSGLRPDERRPEKPVIVVWFGRPTELGLRWDSSSERRNNFDLDLDRARDRRVLEHEVKVDARMHAKPNLTLFAQAIGQHETRDTERSTGTQRTRTHALERGQTWALLERVADTPLTLQVGRVALIEDRSWWWDEDLDAMRLSFTDDALKLDTGVARELFRVSSADSGIQPTDNGLTRWFGQASWRWAPRHTLDAFWLFANDSSGGFAPGTVLATLATENELDQSDLSARWYGLRTSGEVRFKSKKRLTYWADVALLRGTETLTPFSEGADDRFTAGAATQRRLRGRAFDVGVKWRGLGARRPSLTLAWARGSGGERTTVLDDNFRQTGLQENKDKLGGVKRVRYYGDLLDPELSNLDVGTFAFGLRFLKKTSVELLMHYYRQQVASTELAGSRLSIDPAGISRAIGHEFDLFLAMREWRHVELTLRLSRFVPGVAFAVDRRDPAHNIELGATIFF